MKIALYNLEPKIVNTAMMQVSTYHKQQNDDIYIYIYHLIIRNTIKYMLSVYSILQIKDM